LHYDAKDQRTGQWVGQSEDFPIAQKRCLDLSVVSDIEDGDKFQTSVHAVLGKTRPTDREVQYQEGGPDVTFECRGTTLNFSCNLIAKADMLVV